MIVNRFSFAIAESKESCIENPGLYPLTVSVLKAAYQAEMIAYKNYICCSQKAVAEKYPNIAYLFTSFSVSEKIHAENYKNLLKTFCMEITDSEVEVVTSDTRAKLIKASGQELLKIKKVYPDFLKKLERESYDQAVIDCMYSWKSHRQHEKKMSQVNRYAGIFFSGVAKTIEGMKFDFHVCKICGSTIDEPPETPCEICNYPLSYYQRVDRPS